MKTGKKIAVLALIFVAAAIIYFVWPLGRKEENKTGVVYTAMGEAELPVVYPTALGRELAPLFGHREELAVTAERDSLPGAAGGPQASHPDPVWRRNKDTAV